MRFFAKFNDFVVCTDDYSIKEISSGLHLVNLFKDLKNLNFPYFDIFDENMTFIKRIRG